MSKTGKYKKSDTQQAENPTSAGMWRTRQSKRSDTKQTEATTSENNTLATELKNKVQEDEDTQKKQENVLTEKEDSQKTNWSFQKCVIVRTMINRKLVDENLKLHKKYEELEERNKNLQTELETLREVNEDQQAIITKQEKEIKFWKEKYDEVVKEKLSSEQTEKDKIIDRLQSELNALKKDENKRSRGQTSKELFVLSCQK